MRSHFNLLLSSCHKYLNSWQIFNLTLFERQNGCKNSFLKFYEFLTNIQFKRWTISHVEFWVWVNFNWRMHGPRQNFQVWQHSEYSMTLQCSFDFVRNFNELWLFTSLGHIDLSLLVGYVHLVFKARIFLICRPRRTYKYIFVIDIRSKSGWRHFALSVSVNFIFY